MLVLPRFQLSTTKQHKLKRLRPERSTNVTCPEHDEVEAEVTGFQTTRYGDIAFATTDAYGTVTFKLSLDVWSGNGSPQKGELVILSGMSKFRKGWRASKARRFNLSDES
jgi:hypothetical protein